MSIYQSVLTISGPVQEIATNFSDPFEIYGLLLACKQFYNVWKKYIPKLLSMRRLNNVIFAPFYFPSKFNVFSYIDSLQLSSYVTFANRRIGKITPILYNWSTDYEIKVFLTKKLNINGRISFKGCWFYISHYKINGRGYYAYVITHKNKLEAINICKAIYSFSMHH